MLDVMSKGRLEVAFPLGTGMEYWANPMNPATARDKSPRIDRHHSAGVDAGRPDHLLRRLLHLPLPQSLAAALSAAASALLHRRHRQPGDDRARRRARLRLLVGVRHQAARARAQRKAARARRRTRPPPSGPSSYRSGYRLCGRDQGESRGRRPSRTSASFFEDALRTTPQFLAPPGYLSVEQLKTARRARRQTARRVRFRRHQQVVLRRRRHARSGGRATRANGARRMGTNHFNILGAIGNMPHWKVVKNLNLLRPKT